MRRLLHTIDTLGPGGAETVCVELADGVDRSRFRSSVAVIREGWIHDTMLARGLDTSIIRMRPGPLDVSYMWRLAMLARRQRVELIQSHLLTANLYCGVVARLLGIPAVATFHGMVDISPTDRWADLKLRIITANVSRLVFVSEALRRHFVQAHALLDRRTVVIHNGIDERHYRPEPHHALRAELGFDESTVIVGAVGNVRPAKGYDDLLRVAALLRDDYPHIRFVVAGEQTEPLYGELVARRRELGLEDRVSFLGFQTDIATLLNGIDLYLSTSISEGLPLTTLQAMACGLAVVTTRSGGTEEIITDGQDGVLLPVGDPVAAARAVASLAGSSAQRTRLGMAGRETVVRRFTLRRMTSAYEALYEEALAES
jgi:glycosyltransferase involved in cell wall biosynthesis